MRRLFECLGLNTRQRDSFSPFCYMGVWWLESNWFFHAGMLFPRLVYVNQLNRYMRRISLICLLLSSLPAFPWGLRGQQLEIEPPHFTVFHHLHHFAWVKSQAVPSKILNVIGPLVLGCCCCCCCFTGLLPRDGSLLCPKRTQENHP